MSKDTGGPAFPIQGHSTRNGQSFQLVMADGMSLRDYFAAKALQGHLSEGGWNCDQSHFDDVARGAYRLADAMIKARNNNE